MIGFIHSSQGDYYEAEWDLAIRAALLDAKLQAQQL